MDLEGAKILSALLLWILTLCFGLMVPFLMWKYNVGNSQPTDEERESLLSDEGATSNYQTTTRNGKGIAESSQKWFSRFRRQLAAYDILSFINCCCGGLFLGICFLELLPESQESVQQLGFQTTFPVAELLVSVGLLLVMLIEISAIALCLRRQAARSTGYDQIDEPSIGFSNPSCSLAQNESSEPIVNNDLSHTNIAVEVTPAAVEVDHTSEVTRSFVLVIMLSFHSVFEGLALGLEATVSEVFELLIAISVHKCVLAFGIGVKLFETFTPTRVMVAVLCLFIFCSASPLGCAIGIGITSGQNNPNGPNISDVTTVEQTALSLSSFGEVSGTMYASAILECLATGTILYVTFIEVIPSEFSHAHGESVDSRRNSNGGRSVSKLPIKPVVKLMAFIFGFAIVTGLKFV